MFAFPQGDRQNHSLLRLALDRLSSHPTRAYLSLHEPERDLLGGGEPPPGLVGLQFIRKDDRLHIVGHFRHIELSFWWIVNMYEMGRILDWAYDLNKGWAKGKGSIVVQASFASWRSDDPRPIFDSRLDTLPLGDLFDVIVRVGESRIDGLSELSSLLKNKLSHTSEYNIDLAGLSHIQEVLEGVRRMNLRQRRTNGKHLRQLADMISGVTHLLAAAMVESEIDAVRDSVTKAKSELQRAIMSIDRRLAARRNSLASNS
jgi:hypothetical protein